MEYVNVDAYNNNEIHTLIIDWNNLIIDDTNTRSFISSHQSIKTLDSTATTAQTTSSNESIAGDGTITLHKVSKTGNYNDLLNKPTIPPVNNGTLTIQGNGTAASTFTANQSGNTTLNIKGGGNTTVTRSAANEITISSTGGSDTNYYPIRSYTSGLQISTYSGSSNCELWVPDATTTQKGVVEIMTDEEMDAQTGGTSPTASVNPIVDLIYPVGSIYMSRSSSFNPNTAFAGTIWSSRKTIYLEESATRAIQADSWFKMSAPQGTLSSSDPTISFYSPTGNLHVPVSSGWGDMQYNGGLKNASLSYYVYIWERTA